MNLNFVMRATYLGGWVFAALAVLYRALESFTITGLRKVIPATSRGVLIFAAFLFLVSIATAAYAQGQAAMKGRGVGA